MEVCSNQKSVKQIKIYLYLRFFKVATLCLDDSFEHALHSHNGSHLECISINRCALLKVHLWNSFFSKCASDNQVCCDKAGVVYRR